jgi:D-3-phosphoglycerate dehydrogenase
MLLASRDIVGSIQWVREHADDPNVAADAEKAKASFGGIELAGKTLGVIGLGAIGTMVANAGRSLGMNVLGYDPYLSVDYAWSLDRHVHAVRNLGDILTRSDYITIHVPAIDATYHMIGRDQISLMKRGVVVLNYARDVLVDEDAMADALKSGQVMRYVTDFATPKACKMENAIVTTHLGASTVESEDRCALMAISQLKDYLLTGNITNSVNFGDVNLGPMTTEDRIVILHRNIPNMISSFSQILSEAGLYMENMANKRHGDVATTLIEIGGTVTHDVIESIEAMDSVFRARMIAGLDYE